MSRDKISSVVILLTYAAVTVATSQKDAQNNLYQTHSYDVSSNCSNATYTSGAITVTGQTITSPASTSFFSLGFPVTEITVGQDVSGDLAPALTRNCTHAISTALNTTISVYTCTDNSIPSCTISLTHLD